MSDKFNFKSLIAVFAVIVIAIFLFFVLTGQNTPSDERKVVVYTSVDQIFSEPVLKEYEAETGVKVLAVYDVEAAKTTGLTNRLLAEKDNPVADVFWNGEFSKTLLLRDEGVFEPYFSNNSKDIPDEYRDKDGYWTGFGGRARIILVNTDRLSPEDYPDSIFDLLDEKYKAEEIAIAYPMFGTTATHASALYAYLGEEKAKEYFKSLYSKGVRVVDGNSVVRDLVADGSVSIGLTDTDDALGAVERGLPVSIIVPDQGEDQIGTLVIPNTIALVKDAPNKNEGRKLIDYLLSKEMESKLVKSGWFQTTLRDTGEVFDSPISKTIKGMTVSPDEINLYQKNASLDMKVIFIR